MLADVPLLEPAHQKSIVYATGIILVCLNYMLRDRNGNYLDVAESWIGTDMTTT